MAGLQNRLQNTVKDNVEAAVETAELDGAAGRQQMFLAYCCQHRILGIPVGIIKEGTL